MAVTVMPRETKDSAPTAPRRIVRTSAASSVRPATALPVVNPGAPRRLPGTRVAGRAASLGQDFSRYAREQEAAADQEMPDTRKMGRMLASRSAAVAQANKMKFSGRKPSAMLYGGVACIALLKDLLDLAVIGALPGIGTIITICFTFLVFIILAVFDRSDGGGNRMITRGIVLAGVAAVEGLGFGLNFLPIETMTIVFLYILANKAYVEAQRKKR